MSCPYAVDESQVCCQVPVLGSSQGSCILRGVGILVQDLRGYHKRRGTFEEAAQWHWPLTVHIDGFHKGVVEGLGCVGL